MEVIYLNSVTYPEQCLLCCVCPQGSINSFVKLKLQHVACALQNHIADILHFLLMSHLLLNLSFALLVFTWRSHPLLFLEYLRLVLPFVEHWSFILKVGLMFLGVAAVLRSLTIRRNAFIIICSAAAWVEPRLLWNLHHISLSLATILQLISPNFESLFVHCPLTGSWVDQGSHSSFYSSSPFGNSIFSILLTCPAHLYLKILSTVYQEIYRNHIDK